MLLRIWRNLFTSWFQLARWFPASKMRDIRDFIAQGELKHAGELCFAIEARFSLWSLIDGITPRQRAEQIFSALRVWDTQENCGVLVYLQLAEHKIEIVTDRGIAQKVPHSMWQALCQAFSIDMHEKSPDQAVIKCLEQINNLLIEFYPSTEISVNELPNEPVIL
jgi:uncharacterized membrane protein